MAAGTTVQITMPEMGESVTEGTVLEWLKQVGDEVEVDEGLLEVSTDKVDAEVPSPASGVLTEILVGPDETVPTGTVLGVIDVSGGNGRGPRDGDFASGESAVEEATHGAAAEQEHQAAKERTEQLVDVSVPEMGESVSEGTVLEWLKKVGDHVEVDDGLVEISTDKVDAELPSPVAGTVAEILVQPDEVVAVGTVVCRIAVGEGAAAPKPQPEAAAPTPATEAPAGNGDGNATPVAARIASAHGIDIGSIEGSGPRGRVTKEDVLEAVEGNGAPKAPPSAALPSAGSAATRPIRGPAATLVKFMNESRGIPTATSFRTLQVDTLDHQRKALKAAGEKLSFTHIIAWAIVQAAREMPVMANAYAEENGTPQRVTPEGISLGLAVDVERKDGTRSLVVPVLHRADSMTFPECAKRYDELVAGARDNTLKPDAYMGANITLTNPGGLGTVASVPRLMPGQGTIVATGAIAYPAGFTKADPTRMRELGLSKVMTMTSTYDHRVIQGAESGAFLRRVDQLLQGEEAFYQHLFGALGVQDGGPPAGVEERREDGAGPVTAAEPAPSRVRPGIRGMAHGGPLHAGP